MFFLLPFDSASGIPILWCCFFQTIAIGWIFGVKRFAACVEQMTGYKPSLYWIATWGYIAPIVMAVRKQYQFIILQRRVHSREGLLVPQRSCD